MPFDNAWMHHVVQIWCCAITDRFKIRSDEKAITVSGHTEGAADVVSEVPVALVTYGMMVTLVIELRRYTWSNYWRYSRDNNSNNMTAVITNNSICIKHIICIGFRILFLGFGIKF